MFLYVDFKPNLNNLTRLSTRERTIKIIEESAPKYRDIGTFLLRDTTGARVDAIQTAERGDPVEIVRRIFVRWIREDMDHSWEKLTKCFRDCGLTVLASSIEGHFGVEQPQEGIYSCVFLKGDRGALPFFTLGEYCPVYPFRWQKLVILQVF